MIQQLLYLVVIAFAIGIIWWLVDYLAMPTPINKIVKAVIVLVGVIFLINFLLSLTGHGGFIRM